MKSILYATDYSESSITALKYAYRLSLSLNAKLRVVHVFEKPSLIPTKVRLPLSNGEEDTVEAHTRKLEVFCNTHLGDDIHAMNIAVEAISSKSTVDGIVTKAAEIQSLVIVTGMNSKSKLKRLIMGSTATGLIEKASYPVLTIPENINYAAIKTLVYATDFQPEDLDALCKLASIAKPLNAKIIVVHISPLDKKITEIEKALRKEKLDKHVKYGNIELEILYSDAIFTALKTYIDQSNADIIGMLEREGRSYSSDLFYRNLLKKMKSYGKIPLMSFNAKNHGKFHL